MEYPAAVIRDVARIRAELQNVTAKRHAHCIKRRLVVAGYRDPGTFRDATARRGQADPACAAGDQHGFVRKP